MKRMIDLMLSVSLLLLAGPLMVGLWLVLLIVNKGAPLFIQTRPGKNGRPFNILKFKTMRSPQAGEEISDEERMIPFGRILRKTSLDELPQLINVLKGEMSLVGPRPLLMEYLPLYTAREYQRHDVRPGITGWAQVNGRNSLSWEQKMHFDLWYVEHCSLRLDLNILGMTALQLLSLKKIAAGNPEQPSPLRSQMQKVR